MKNSKRKTKGLDMYSDKVKLFPKQTIDWIMNYIESTREEFKKEMSKQFLDPEREMHFGSRFNSNKDVCHATIMGIKMPNFGESFDGDAARKRWATQLEISWHMNHSMLKNAIWEGFKNAAHADYVYEVDGKDYL